MRRNARRSYEAWCRFIGNQLDEEPAKHHLVLIHALQEVVDRVVTARKTKTFGAGPRLAVLMPPGSAKSTYSSVRLPPWFLAQMQNLCILACSYNGTLADRFGRQGRGLVDLYSTVLGYQLSQDSKAAGEWETSNQGRYFCAGVGSGIAGHRADLGLIDDPIGSIEDADSELMRDKAWDWYEYDFEPRLKPGAAVVLVMTHWHEDDLWGRIKKHRAHENWVVIRIPMIAETKDDVLARAPGERLWQEWFTQEQVDTARKNPRKWNGPYQQNPTPEEGDFFKREWLHGYEPQDLPDNLQIYSAGDFAISKRDEANSTVMGSGGVDSKGNLYILPDIFWEQASADRIVDGMIAMFQRRKPLLMRAEKGHISMSLAPFIRKRQRDERIFAVIEEYVPSKDKRTRARPVQGMMELGMVFFPKFATWWPQAEHQLISFDNSGEDDFVDFLAHLGALVDRMFGSRPKKDLFAESAPPSVPLTFGRLRKQAQFEARLKQLVYADN